MMMANRIFILFGINNIINILYMKIFIFYGKYPLITGQYLSDNNE